MASGAIAMAQLFRPGANSVAVVVIVGLFAGPAIAMGITYALWYSPYATGQFLTWAQPVPFSHKHHVGDLGLDCRMCHAGVEKAAFAGIPSAQVCMTCHSQLFTDAPMLAPLRESAASGVPLRWTRVHRLPDFAYFDHAIHVRKGVECSECHGRVDRMPLMRRVAPLTMQWCLDCHRNPGPRNGTLASTRRLTDCSTCHR